MEEFVVVLSVTHSMKVFQHAERQRLAKSTWS